MHEWNVEFLLADPPDDNDLIALQDHIDDLGLDGSVSADPRAGQWAVSFGVTSTDARDAMYEAETFLGKALDRTPAIVGVEVLTHEELERRADQPTMPTLIGASEVAALLHVTRQRVHQLRQHPAFPVPLVEVAMGPLWDERAVEKFSRVWVRTPGRRPLPTPRPSAN